MKPDSRKIKDIGNIKQIQKINKKMEVWCRMCKTYIQRVGFINSEL